MNLEKNKLTKEEEELFAAREAEKLEILANTNEDKTIFSFIDNQGNFNTESEVDKIISDNTDDPQTKHTLYYKSIERLLKSFINPKRMDKETKKAFKLLREEKNILLTHGKRKNEKGIRNADARQGYVGDMKMALNIIIENIGKGATPLQLYYALQDKNIELGYYSDMVTNRHANINNEQIRDIINKVRELQAEKS